MASGGGDSQQYIDRDLFDSTGFYVGLSNSNNGDSRNDSSSSSNVGRRADLSSIHEESIPTTASSAATSATAATGDDDEAGRGSDSTAAGSAGSHSSPRGMDGASHNTGLGLAAGGARKASTRPSMIRVGSTSVSLNYLSALADADGDDHEEDSGIWGG